MVDNQELETDRLHIEENGNNVPRIGNTKNNARNKLEMKNDRSINDWNKSKQKNKRYPYILRQCWLFIISWEKKLDEYRVRTKIEEK